MGITAQLANFAVSPLPPGFLSSAAVDAVKAKFLDTVGIMVAGSRSAGSQVVLQTAMEMGGHPEATIVGRAERTAAVHAGFVNGVSAHALEYDDNPPTIGHVSACMVPGCLAVAEKLNLSGRQVIEAFAVGYEVAARISVGLKPALFDRGWHPPVVNGAMGVVMASSRLMALDQLQTRMAMGLTASSAAGVRKNVGSAGKAFHIGNAVRAGLMSAQLAKNGFCVDPDIIEASEGEGEGHAQFGLADTFAGKGNYDLQRMIAGLGEDSALTRPTRVRMRPGATIMGAAIDGIISLAMRHNLTPGEVEELKVTCHPSMLVIASYAEPFDTYRAKFCAPYTFAVALADRKVGLAQYSEERIKDLDVLNLMKHVKVVARESVKTLHGEAPDAGEVGIAISLKDGRLFQERATHTKGWPGHPVSWSDLCQKYEECVSGILSPQQIKDSMAMINDLQDIRSIQELMRTLAAR